MSSRIARKTKPNGEVYLFPDTKEHRDIVDSRKSNRLAIAGKLLWILGSMGVVLGILVGGLALALTVPIALIEDPTFIHVGNEILMSDHTQFALLILVLGLFLRTMGDEVIARTPLSKALATNDVVALPKAQVDLERAPSTIHGTDTDLFLYSAAQLGLADEAMAEVVGEIRREEVEVADARIQETRSENLDQIISLARQREGAS